MKSWLKYLILALAILIVPTHASACKNDAKIYNIVHLPVTYPTSLVLTGATIMVERNIFTMSYILMRKLADSNYEYSGASDWVWDSTEAFRCPL